MQESTSKNPPALDTPLTCKFNSRPFSKKKKPPHRWVDSSYDAHHQRQVHLQSGSLIVLYHHTPHMQCSGKSPNLRSHGPMLHRTTALPALVSSYPALTVEKRKRRSIHVIACTDHPPPCSDVPLIFVLHHSHGTLKYHTVFDGIYRTVSLIGWTRALTQYVPYVPDGVRIPL